jgi:hypothetical protein
VVTPSPHTLARQALERSHQSASSAIDLGAIQRDDLRLYELRALEITEESWPTRLPKLRRIRLICSDKLSTTWECWSNELSQRVLAKVIRPSISTDPVWRRRFARGAEILLTTPHLNEVIPYLDEKWPHLVFPLSGLLLSDGYPEADSSVPVVESRLLAVSLMAGLNGLAELHAKGLVHGAVNRDCIVLERQSAKLVWIDPFGVTKRDQSSDIASLAESLTVLDPQASEPLGALVATWVDTPPPSVDMAKALFIRTLATHLTSSRHQLLLRSRMVNCKNGEARLLRAVKSLACSLAPPSGKFCLKADEDGLMVVAISDGQSVTGGGVASVPAKFIPTVYSPETGIDPSASRVLLRSWATRRSGDQTLRTRVMEELGGDDKRAEQLCIWLSAQARLRAARKLLEL